MITFDTDKSSSRAICLYVFPFRHARYYLENKRYDNAYNKSRDKDRYYNDHYNLLELFWAAKNWLKNVGIDTASLNTKQIEEHLGKLVADKDALTNSFTTKESELAQLKKATENLYIFLNMPEKGLPVHEKIKPPNKDI